MTRIEGSKFMYSAGGRSAYLPDGREAILVATTQDGAIGVLTDHDRWYVATLRIVSGVTAATVLKVHGGNLYAYRDADRLAARMRDTPPGVPLRTTTKEQDGGVARKAPFFIAAVIVVALVTPPILLIVWIPAVIFLALAWLGARSDG